MYFYNCKGVISIVTSTASVFYGWKASSIFSECRLQPVLNIIMPFPKIWFTQEQYLKALEKPFPPLLHKYYHAPVAKTVMTMTIASPVSVKQCLVETLKIAMAIENLLLFRASPQPYYL